MIKEIESNNQTIGEAIDDLAKKYQSLYHRIVEYDFVENPKSMTLQDLWIQRYIYNEAYKKVEQYIDEQETIK